MHAVALKTWITQDRNTDRLLSVLVLVALVVPRLLTVSTYVTIDEHKWLARSLAFQHALARGDLAETYQSTHPGVTTMWAGALGHLLRCPSCLGSEELTVGAYEDYVTQKGAHPLSNLVTNRKVMIVIEAILLWVAYHFGRELVGQKAATLGFLFIALDPFFAAHTQILHLDGMLASLTTVWLLALVHFLQTHRARSLALSGIAMGLSWLTKLPSALIVPAVGVMILVDLVKAGVQWPSIRRRLLWLCLLGLIGSAVYFALWPALWISPLKWFTNMLNKTTAHVELGHASALFFRGEIHSGGQLGLSFYPISYLWRSSPVVLAGLVAAFVASLKPGKRSHPILSRHVMANLLIFVAVYGVGMSLGSHKFDRYLLPVYPPLMLLAAAGWVALISQIVERTLSKRHRLVGVGLLTVVVAVHGFGLVQTFPYYLSYYNPMMGGHRKAGEVFTLGWGEGLDQAAAYLNEKPDAEDLKVATWYSYSFSYFFRGETRTILNRPSLGADYLDFLLSSDYIIIYINQWQRQIPASFVERMMAREPEHIVHIGPVPYAFIYRQD
jgi:hypothetical protein